MGEEVNIRLESSANGLYRIQIIDIKGRVMLSAQHTNTANRMDYAMKLSQLNTVI